MRSKLTKTIILIVFVVFLGINNVNAETCTFSYATNRINQMYIIETDSAGKVIKIQFKEVDIQTNEVKTNNDMTETLTVDFTGCPVSIGKVGNKLTVTQSTYRNVDKLGNSNESEYIGSMDPGEDLTTVSCGEITDIPQGIPKATRIIYLLLQILIPVALVVFAMIDLMKAVTAQKEDEIKKGQQTLIKKLISAAIVFFVFAFVKIIVSALADNTSIGKCLNCFIKGDCEATKTEPENSNQNPGGGGNPHQTSVPY